MKQQINLYLPEFRIKRDNLTVLLMLQMLGVLASIMVVLASFDFWRSYRLDSRLADLREVLAEETRRTTEVDALLARRSQDTTLAAQLEVAEEALNASRQVRDFFNSRTGGNTAGFSEYLKDLSRASIDGLWITEFSIVGSGSTVELKGFTIDSALVPSFVARLQQGRSPMVQKHFGFSTTRAGSTDRLYAFDLSTER